MPARRIGVLGGTFDPIHLGHLAVARAAIDALALDLVILVPAGDPWMKPAGPHASGEERLAMVELAIAGDRRLAVSRVDLDRSGPSYTVDTLTDLHGEFDGEAEWYFLLGADALADVPRWHEPQHLMRLAHLVGVRRTGHELVAPELPDAAWSAIEMPPVDVSSTAIRARIAAGAPIDGLVPAAVAEFIAQRGLYR